MVHHRHVIEVTAAQENDGAPALVADAYLFRLEAIVRRLDTADARLQRLPSTRTGGHRRHSCTQASVADSQHRTPAQDEREQHAYRGATRSLTVR